MKRRVWKWLLGIAAAPALVVDFFVWSAHSRATAVFERHDALVKEAIAAIRARPPGRPPLDEPRIPGNGWSAYLSALSAIKDIPQAEMDEAPSYKWRSRVSSGS